MTRLPLLVVLFLVGLLSFLPGLASGNEVCEFSSYPVPVVFYTPETDVGLGVGVPTAFKMGSSCTARKVNLLIPAVIYTSKRQSIGRVFSKQFFSEEAYFTDLTAAFNHYPDKYYGNGDGTDLADEEVFTERYSAISADGYRRLWDSAYLGIGAVRDVFRIEDIEPGRSLASGAVTGGDGGAVVGVGLKGLYNTRDNEFQPRQGVIVEGGALRFAKAYGGDFDYLHKRGRVRWYEPIGTGRTLAFDLQWEDNQGEVPFRKLAQLGGQYFVRGFFLGRYRDHTLAGGQLEFRHDLTERWSLVEFAGAGKVAAAVGALGGARLIGSGGVGVRYVLDLNSRINLRLDFSGGGDSKALYFGVGDAF